MRDARGFTLIEAAVSTAIIALIIAAVGYGVGAAGGMVREERRAYHRVHLVTSKLNELDATPFDALAAGADTIALEGGTYLRGWRFVRFDGNGDAVADPGLLLVTVWVDSDTCQTLRCDVE